MPREYTRRPLADRFWEKVEKTETCWLWTANTVRGGYGQITLGWKEGKGLSHHVAWFLAHGEWPSFLRHTCDTPACVRLDHLVPSNALDNMQDKHAKGRQRYLRGADLPHTKLTDEDVTAIRASTMPHRVLAELFGVSRSHISGIKTGHKRI